jgi:hypothetical protein
MGEHLGRVGGDAGTGGPVGIVVEADAAARPGLDQHLMAVMHQLANARRHQPDAILVGLDLPGHTDQHFPFLGWSGGRATATADWKQRTPGLLVSVIKCICHGTDRRRGRKMAMWGARG